MSLEDKLVWTEEDYRKWLETFIDVELSEEMLGYATTYYEPNPLKPVKVDLDSIIILEEELDYDGSLVQFRKSYPKHSSYQVLVKPFFNKVPLTLSDNSRPPWDEDLHIYCDHRFIVPSSPTENREVRGDDQRFRKGTPITFKKGDKVKVVLENFDSSSHIVCLRFFSKKR